MDTLMTLMSVLDVLFWVGGIAFAGLIVTSLTFVFSKGKNEKTREHSKWWTAGIGVVIVLALIGIGVISEQIDAVADEMISEAETLED